MEHRLPFSISRENSTYLKLFLGPVLLSFALLVAPSPVIATVALLGLGGTYFYGVRGALGTFALLFILFLFTYNRMVWELTWHLSIGLSHVITAFALDELRIFFKTEKEALYTDLTSLKAAHTSLEKKALEEKLALQDKLTAATQKLSKAEDDIISLKRLSDAVRVESNKLYKETAELQATLDANERELTTLRQEVETTQNRLNELNEKRVENFQMKQLLKEEEPKVQEPVIEEPIFESPPVPEEQIELDELGMLELKKKEAKALYQQAVDEKSEDVKDKRHVLVDIERKLFNLKKSMRDQGELFRA